MSYQERIDKVHRIFQICEEKGHNKFTIAFLLANYNDEELEKFYNEYLNIK
jgi:hypothetical protein